MREHHLQKRNRWRKEFVEKQIGGIERADESFSEQWKTRLHARCPERQMSRRERARQFQRVRIVELQKVRGVPNDRARG
jgi:hypothetical protein